MLPDRVTVACLAVGEFSDEYVWKLASMLERHMPCPFDLVCAVDRPRRLPQRACAVDVRGWPYRREGMRPTTYKLGFFDPKAFPFGEFLYLDTSLVIRQNMTGLIEFAFRQPQDLVLVRDWNYDSYNTSVMRIRQTAQMAGIPKAYAAGVAFDQRVPGDQEFVTGVVRLNGLQDRVSTFPEPMVACYGRARAAARQGWGRGRAMLDEATVVKFNGRVKMHHLLDPRFRMAEALRAGNPFHRRAWFWVRELKANWR